MAMINAALIFSVATIIHLTIWKINIPKKQEWVLLKIYYGTLILAVILFYELSYYLKSSNVLIPIGYLDYLHIVIFFTAITLAYLITYSALNADSPSIVMILKLADAGECGLNKNDLEKYMNDEILVIPRIEDLLKTNMVRKERNIYTITGKGIIFVRIFIFYRKLIRASMGG